MIQPDDAVICLSKSGETSEIKVLIPLLKSFGNPLIAMTANRNSTLARQADFLLWTPVDQEADPNNLAPTTSTISQMALGDALAIVLLTNRGFSAADFAKFHPGGALGKQLYLRVRDLYDRNEKPSVRLDATLNEVILEISAKRLGATAVLDNDNRLAGIITDGDLRRMLQQQTDFPSLKAADILTRSPKFIGPDEMAVDAFALMRNHSITQAGCTRQRKIPRNRTYPRSDQRGFRLKYSRRLKNNPFLTFPRHPKGYTAVSWYDDFHAQRRFHNATQRAPLRTAPRTACPAEDDFRLACRAAAYESGAAARCKGGRCAPRPVAR
jgi:KpsF/GutQ family protein